MKNLTLTLLILAFSPLAIAGTPPTIISACVMQIGTTKSISGVLSDPDFDAVSVAPLGVGVCVDGTIPNYTYPASYNCNVPAAVPSVTLVAMDAEGNASAPRDVDLTTIPKCVFY